MTIEWKLKLFYIEELKEWEHNPRILSKHDYKHLKISLEKFGLIDKPILNHDLTLIGGHQRIKILKDNGLKKIECWYPSRELSQEEFKELNIRLNKNTGEFDFDLLSNIFDTNQLLAFGFEEKELLDGFEIPKFDDDAENSSPDLTEKKLTKCPECGHEF